jgi:hypothetical protein
MRNIIGLIILILIHSCASKNQEIIKDENGNIVLKCELKNGIRHGKCYEYFPNSTIMGISSWVAGVQDGEAISYFENGSIKQTSMWKEGMANGECIDYFENGSIKIRGYIVNNQQMEVEFYDEDSRLQKINYYIIVNRQSRLNGAVVYDVDNAVNYPYNIDYTKSMYAEIFADRDTIDCGNFAEYEVQWMCSNDHYVGAITGNIDQDFNIIDSSSLKRVDLDNKNRFYPSNPKLDTLRVIFQFKEIRDGEHFAFQSYLEKVFTIREK